MQRVLSPAARFAIAVMASMAMPMSSACQTLESVPILSASRASSDATAVSAPMTDTARQSRTVWPIEPASASYNLVRWHLDHRRLPPPEAIRIGDLATAFDDALRSRHGSFAPRRDDVTFTPLRGDVLGMTVEVFPSPTRPGYHVMHLSLRGTGHRKAGRRTTVFVVVVEGSAAAIPRIRAAIRELADGLEDRDLLGLVARGLQGRMVLEPTRLGARGRGVTRALDALTGNDDPDLITGLLTGYEMATRHSGDHPVRILLLSDGAMRSPGDELFDDLRRQARAGFTLSVVGFPVPGRRRGYDHPLMTRLARSGGGRYAVVDNQPAARGLFSRLPDRLAVVARDVTGRIELNPETVSRFRFLGGPLPQPVATGDGSGHSLGTGDRATTLIELQLTGRPGPLGNLRVRYRPAEGGSYRPAEGDEVKQFEMTLGHQQTVPGDSDGLLPWIAATFGEKLGGSFWTRDVSYSRLLSSFRSLDAGRRTDPRTAELRYLIQQARRLTARRVPPPSEGTVPGSRHQAGDVFEQLRVLE